MQTQKVFLEGDYSLIDLAADTTLLVDGLHELNLALAWSGQVDEERCR